MMRMKGKEQIDQWSPTNSKILLEINLNPRLTWRPMEQHSPWRRNAQASQHLWMLQMNKKFTNFLDGILHASDIAENKTTEDSENRIG